MPNLTRESSDYIFELSPQQKEALLEIAFRRDRPFEELVHSAIDSFIEREKNLCAPRS